MIKINILVDALLVFMRLYYYILLARIIMSWFMMSGSGEGNPTLNTIYQFVYGVTEPLLAPLRSFVPKIPMGMGYLDLSPIILLILLRIFEAAIRNQFY